MEKLIEVLQGLVSQDDVEALLSYEEGELEYWDGGNADDTFALGVEVGYTMAVQEIIKIIQEENKTWA